MRKTRVVAGVAIVLVSAIAVAGFRWQEQQERNGQRLFSQVASLVSEQYVDSVGAGKIFESAATGIVEALNDPYSELIPPVERETFERVSMGRYGGIGALVETRTGNRVHIEKVYPNTPAEAGGVQEGDRIIAVDGKSTEGFEMARVTSLLRGEPGTRVRVGFERTGVAKPIELTLTRAVVRVPAVPFAIMLEGNIGYIPLQTFNETAAQEVTASVQKLTAAGATKLILDMRGNTGGMFDQSLDIASLFLDPGQQIVNVRGRVGGDEISTATEPSLRRKLPLVVMTDESSASATEIVAGALQDHDRALVIGARTFGKGLVQRVFQLDGGYALKLTTAKWYTPSGRSIHRDRELTPDGRFRAVGDTGTVASLPKFKSGAGRTLTGGGGIFPDVLVPLDTLPAAERDYLRATAPQSGTLVSLLHDAAVRWRTGVRPNFEVNAAWIDTLARQLDSAGVKSDASLNETRRTVLRRELDRRITRLAFGDSGLARRDIPSDRQLVRAIELLKAANTPEELLRK